MIRSPDWFHRLKMFAVTGTVAAEDDHAFAGIIARTPKPVALVIADRFRQTVLLPEKIDRARLAVIIREDRGLRALFGWKRVVNFADFPHHFLPAEFVGKMLRQRTGRLILGFQRRDPERLLIRDVILR